MSKNPIEGEIVKVSVVVQPSALAIEESGTARTGAALAEMIPPPPPIKAMARSRRGVRDGRRCRRTEAQGKGTGASPRIH